MAKPAKKETATLDETLVAVATDINEVLKLDPEIETEGDGITDETILEDITANAIEILPEDKKSLKPSTWKFLEENKLIDHIKPTLAKTKETKADAKPAAAKGSFGPQNLPKRFSKKEGLIEILKGGERNLDKIVKSVDALVVKNGGKSNMLAIKEDMDWLVSVLVRSEIAIVTKDGKIEIGKEV